MTKNRETPLFAAVGEALRRHREAVLARRPADIAAANELLARLLVEAAEGSARATATSTRLPGTDAGAVGTGALAAAARELREAVNVNLTLAQNGIAIVNHFACALAADACSAGGSSPDDPALFAGVA